MSVAVSLRSLSEREAARLDVALPGVVDLRRDVHQLLRFVDERGLVRTRRGNRIPLGAARRLAGLLSWAGEKQAIEKVRAGVWSDYVCDVARCLGLVAYDTEGTYVGYTSTEPSFPDNEVEVVAAAWKAWRRKTALQKERALLDVLIEKTPNEFFQEPTLLEGAIFDRRGCATGPAGGMDLRRIRRTLLDLLATLEVETWIELADVVDLLGSRHPQLIIDPAHREPTAESLRAQRQWKHSPRGERCHRGPKPPLVFADRYANFREYDANVDRWKQRGGRAIVSDEPGAFHRVEGRYVEFFLREIPYLLGFVGLAYRRASDRHGLDVLPPFQRLRAVRTTPRLRQILRHDASFDAVKVTVLPTFEVLVEAPSYPETTLEALEPHAVVVSEERPLHHLRLEKSRVVASAAGGDASPSCASLLERLSGQPLPQNVAFELGKWTARGERVTLQEGLGILEVAGDEAVREEALAALGDLVVAAPVGRTVLVRDPDRAVRALESKGLAPLLRTHPPGGFAAGKGALGSQAPLPRESGRAAAARTKARLACEDLVGYQSDVPALLDALEEGLPESGRLRAAPDRLVFPAAWLPRVRKRLRALGARFDITLEEGPSPSD